MKHLTKEQKIELQKDTYGSLYAVSQYRIKSKEFRSRLKKKKEQKRNEVLRQTLKARKLQNKEKLKAFARILNSNLPKSEVWFWNMYKNFKDSYDYKNVPFGSYIFDLLNHKYKYAIEVDGSIHSTKDQQRRDGFKNSFCKRNNYNIFRITAYNEVSFYKAINHVIALRNLENRS